MSRRVVRDTLFGVASVLSWGAVFAHGFGASILLFTFSLVVWSAVVGLHIEYTAPEAT